METSRRSTFGLAALVALAMVAAYVLGTTAQGGAFASPTTQTPPSTQQTQQTAPSADASKQEAAAREQRLLDGFVANFTSRLGVDEARLNSAFTEAVNATVDQAVTDSTLTQSEADAAKALVSKIGFRGMIASAFRSGEDKMSGSLGDEYANPKAALLETMNNIGVSNEEIGRGVDAGKSLASLAAEHGVDAPTLKTRVLQTFRSHLDTGVREGKLTQAQADDQYDRFAPMVDEIINRAGRPSSK
jgi:uncharacterized protein YidB (DUF937 family)